VSDGHSSGHRQQVGDHAQLLDALVQLLKSSVYRDVIIPPVKAAVGSGKAAFCRLYQRELGMNDGPF